MTCKIKEMLSKPTKFFKSVENEGIGKVLIYFVIASLVVGLISMIFKIPYIVMSGTLSTDIILLLENLLKIVIGGTIASFVFSAFIHLGVLILRGRKGFKNTYKPVTYGLFIITMYLTLQSIITTVYATIIGSSPFTLATKTVFANNNVMTLIMLLISIICLIHVIVFNTIGISKLQKMSKLSAFFGLMIGILIPTLIYIVIYVLYILYFSVGVPAVTAVA